MEDDEKEERVLEREKVKEANKSAQIKLSKIHHHIRYTLQKAYFKCAYECYGNRSKDEVEECVEYCSVPVLKAHYLYEEEMAHFQDRLKESMKVCQDKFEVAKKIQENKIVAMNELSSCVNQTVEESIETLPYVVERLKHFLSID